MEMGFDEKEVIDALRVNNNQQDAAVGDYINLGVITISVCCFAGVPTMLLCKVPIQDETFTVIFVHIYMIISQQETKEDKKINT